MYEWNKTFLKILEIKHLYEKNIGDIPWNNYSPEKNIFSYIVKALNIKEYSEWEKTLSINYYKGLLLFHYEMIAAAEEMWNNPNSLNREARGLVIDLKNEEIVNCPFKKFFNINEIPETSLENIMKRIKKASLFEITDKLDGSIQSVSLYKGNIIIAGSENFDPDMSWRVADSYKYFSEHPNYINMVETFPNKTFIFESIAEKDPHIVFYDKTKYGLYLIGIRDKYTGLEVSYAEVLEIAREYSVLSTKIEKYTLEELFDARAKFKSYEKEGWVLSIDGFKVKFKCEDYLNMHKAYTKQSLGKLLIIAVENDTVDDLISTLPKVYKEIALEMLTKITEYVKNEKAIIYDYFEKAPKESRIIFIQYVNKEVPKKYRYNVINLFDNKPIYILKLKNGNYIKTDELGLKKILIIPM